FYGDWSFGTLLFQRASVFGGVNDAMMLRTSLASCRSDLQVMYAVAGGILKNRKNEDVDTLYRVLRSTDGGQSWLVTGNKVANRSEKLFGDPETNLPGNQQEWNNCIAVSPFDRNRVAIAWRDGYFFSIDGAKEWTFFSADSSPHLHIDFHAVAFDPFD